MKVSLILAHPSPGSFNHAIAEKAQETLERNGYEVAFHDLYLEGFDYEFLEGDSGEGVPCRRLLARTALVFNTSNTDARREQNSFGDPLQRIWEDCIFGLCGVTEFYRKMFSVVVTSSPSQRGAWLDEVQATVDEYFPGRGEKAR